MSKKKKTETKAQSITFGVEQKSYEMTPEDMATLARIQQALDRALAINHKNPVETRILTLQAYQELSAFWSRISSSCEWRVVGEATPSKELTVK